MDDILDLGKGQMPKINIKEAPIIKCDKCGGNLFERNYIIKKISGLAIGYGSEDFAYPIDVLVCKKCGEILKDHKEEIGLIEENKEEKKTNKFDLIV